MSPRARSVNVSTLCQLGTRKEEAVQEDKDSTPPSLRRSVGSGARPSGTRQGERVRQQDNETLRGNVSKMSRPARTGRISCLPDPSLMDRRLVPIPRGIHTSHGSSIKGTVHPKNNHLETLVMPSANRFNQSSSRPHTAACFLLQTA